MNTLDVTEADEDMEWDVSSDDELDTFEYSEKKPRVKEIKETEEYVNKEEMWNVLRDYYDSVSTNEDMYIPENLARMIEDIIDHMARRPNFNGYSKTWIEDMKGDAREKMYKAIKQKSFDLYTETEVIQKYTSAQGIPMHKFNYIKPKTNKMIVKERKIEPSDEFILKDGKEYVIFKNNAFGYYSRTAWYCFINRIKLEKRNTKAKLDYQATVYENMYASDNWKQVRRHKIIYGDDGCFNESES